MIQFGSFTGEVISIQNAGAGEYRDGCVQMFQLQNEDGNVANFIVTPGTFVLNQKMIRRGDTVTGYYDRNAPMILIYPPQYPALVMVKERTGRNVKVSYFNQNLVSQDNGLALNLQPETRVITTNGQAFRGNPGNHNLVVTYGASTKSIPAQTSPGQVVVLCRAER